MQNIPNSRENEEAVIGAVLINPEIYYDLSFLPSDDFYIVRNKWIWDAFSSLAEKRIPIDLLTVANELDARGMLDEVGGSAYLTALVGQVPSSLNAESYARAVQGFATRRRYIFAANKIAGAAYDDGKTIEELINIANHEIILADGVPEESNFKKALSAVYDEAGENAKKAEGGMKIDVGLTTGWIDLDRILMGIEDEESVIVAARPGQGKTSFMLNLASHAALNLGKRIAFFSQEMSAKQIVRRLVSQYTEIDSQRIKTGVLAENEWPIFTHAIEMLEATNIYLSDASSLTPAKLRSKCLQLQRQNGLDLVFIDYLQLMSAGVRTDTRNNEVGYISAQIKHLARELGKPIITASQLSRANEQRANKRPVLSDLRDSGNIEQDANIVIFLYRPDEDDRQNVAEVIVAKRRDGPVGDCELIFRSAITKFVNATTKIFRPNG